MLAQHFSATPEWVLWNIRLDRGLIYQHALLRARDVWTVPPSAPEDPASESDFERLLNGDTETET
jgi:hypothetical protein